MARTKTDHKVSAIKHDKCPKCASPLNNRWVSGRKLQQYCEHEDDNGDPCGWVGVPRTPEKRRIVPVKDLHSCGLTEWCFEIYDKFGHIMISSRSYDSRAELVDDMEEELKMGVTSDYGPYTAVMYHVPPVLKVKGKMFVVRKGRVVVKQPRRTESPKIPLKVRLITVDVKENDPVTERPVVHTCWDSTSQWMPARTRMILRSSFAKSFRNVGYRAAGSL